MTKFLPNELFPVLQEFVKNFNYIKALWLNCRLFNVMSKEMEANHQPLVFHTEVR